MNHANIKSIAFPATLALLSCALASALALGAEMGTQRTPACEAAQSAARFDFESQRTDGNASATFQWKAPAECQAPMKR